MSDAKEISIVTVVYKDPKGLQKTLESLKPLAQSSASWEHIIVDSSPEEHKSVLNGFRDIGPRTYVTESPTGIYPAMNHGWRLAQGKLLYFLNSGDRLKSATALEKAIEQFKKDVHLDLLLCTAELYRDGKFLYSKAPHPSFLRNILGFNSLCHQAAIYRRAGFGRVGEFSTRYRLASDYEHHFRCYLAGLKHKAMNLHIVEYDMEGQSSNFEKVLMEYGLIHQAMASRLPAFAVKLNDLLLQWEIMRLRMIKKAAASRFSDTLRPLWLWWHRNRNT